MNRTASQSSSPSGSSSSLEAMVATPTPVATPAPTTGPTVVGDLHVGVETAAGVGLKLEALLRASSSSTCFFANACLSLHVIPVLLTDGLVCCCCSCNASCARFSNGLTSLLGLGSCTGSQFVPTGPIRSSSAVLGGVTTGLGSSLTGCGKSRYERCNVDRKLLILTAGAGGVGRVAVGRGGAGVGLAGAGAGSQSSSGAGVDLTGGGAVYLGWNPVVAGLDHC